MRSTRNGNAQVPSIPQCVIHAVCNSTTARRPHGPERTNLFFLRSSLLDGQYQDHGPGSSRGRQVPSLEGTGATAISR